MLGLKETLLAILLAAPKLPLQKAEQYAEVIHQQAVKIDVSESIFIAIITHESNWNEKAISGDGLDRGLMQVRSRYYGGNKNNLLNGVQNIIAGSYLINKKKEWCSDFLHREAKTQEWLQCYDGACIDGQVCKSSKMTDTIERFAKCIENDVAAGTNSNCRKIYWPNG